MITDTLDVAAELDEAEAQELSNIERLPFSYASAHGVMLEEATRERAKVLHRPGLTLEVLLELQRCLGVNLELEEIPADDFQKRLTKEYQSGDGAAQRRGSAAARREVVDVAEGGAVYRRRAAEIQGEVEAAAGDRTAERAGGARQGRIADQGERIGIGLRARGGDGAAQIGRAAAVDQQVCHPCECCRRERGHSGKAQGQIVSTACDRAGDISGRPG